MEPVIIVFVQDSLAKKSSQVQSGFPWCIRLSREEAAVGLLSVYYLI